MVVGAVALLVAVVLVVVDVGGGGADMYTLDPLSFVLELSAQET